MLAITSERLAQCAEDLQGLDILDVGYGHRQGDPLSQVALWMNVAITLGILTLISRITAP